MVEMAPADGGLFAMGFAGDTFNTAWYARRVLPADWQVGYFTAIGTDAVSDDMAAFMAREGIDTAAVRRVPDRTVGLYMIQLKRGERSFSYWRGQSAAKTLADDTGALGAALAGVDIVHFSGITLAILSAPARQAFCAALARARAAGSHIAFDTNLRPRLWPGAEAMRDGLMQGAAVADTVLPSLDEEALAFGDATAQDTIARYRAAGASTVAVKNGAETCHVWSADEGAFSADPPEVARIVDSTAAGDSFAAAFLAARAEGAAVQDAAARATALAAQVVQRRGALAPEIFEKGGTS
ncbi:sugar kinase [Rhodovulum iodosum]|nr:sugar kinase [Rhodovulum robiginosum]RSK36471.1 sugar kinase [Rhodovulum robiginosum]